MRYTGCVRHACDTEKAGVLVGWFDLLRPRGRRLLHGAARAALDATDHFTNGRTADTRRTARLRAQSWSERPRRRLREPRARLYLVRHAARGGVARARDGDADTPALGRCVGLRAIRCGLALERRTPRLAWRRPRGVAAAHPRVCARALRATLSRHRPRLLRRARRSRIRLGARARRRPRADTHGGHGRRSRGYRRAGCIAVAHGGTRAELAGAGHLSGHARGTAAHRRRLSPAPGQSSGLLAR